MLVLYIYLVLDGNDNTYFDIIFELLQIMDVALYLYYAGCLIYIKTL